MVFRLTLHATVLCILGAAHLAAQDPAPFSSLVLGERNTCGLTAEGAAYCWGDNSFGQLGDGSTDRRTVPTPVAGGHRFILLSIAGSVEEATDGFGRAVEDLKGVHVCGLSTDSTAYCWGADGLGQVGAGMSQRKPRTVPTMVATDARFATLSTNLGQSCAVTAEGLGYCWGTPGFLIEDGTTLQIYSTPFALPAELQIRSLVLDGFQICGLTAQGTGICWRGKEQRGAVTFREVEIPDGALSSLIPARVLLGNGYCGLDTNQRWLCWDLVESPVGSFTTAPREESPGVGFTAIRASSDVRCGLATTGALHCNLAGARDSIAPEVTGEAFESLVDSGSEICGLRADGRARCVRKLILPGPDGTPIIRLGFDPVPGDLQWRRLYVTASHSCGITVTHITYCWGENGSGQLGDGSRKRRTHPVEVRQ